MVSPTKRPVTPENVSIKRSTGSFSNAFDLNKSNPPDRSLNQPISQQPNLVQKSTTRNSSSPLSRPSRPASPNPSATGQYASTSTVRAMTTSARVATKPQSPSTASQQSARVSSPPNPLVPTVEVSHPQRGQSSIPSSQKQVSQQAPQSVKQDPSMISGQTHQNDPSVSVAVPDIQQVQNINDVRSSYAIRFELVFALASSALFLGLWIYAMNIDCPNSEASFFYIKLFSLMGAIIGLGVTIYCCFERFPVGLRGCSGCLLFGFVVIISCLNLIGAYFAANCVCLCNKNALRGGAEDLIIMILDILGSLCLLAVLLVATVANQT